MKIHTRYQAIIECKKDLDKMSDRDLNVLARHFKVPNNTKAIATVIMDKQFQHGNMESSNNDINALLQQLALEQSKKVDLLDRIEQINELKNSGASVSIELEEEFNNLQNQLEYQIDLLNNLRKQKDFLFGQRDSKEAERNRNLRLIAEQESNVLHASAKDCSNDADLISLENWSDTNKPNLKIKYMTQMEPLTKIDRIVCYDSEELKRWIKFPDNTFAIWVSELANYYAEPDPDGYGIDGVGPGKFGYMPSKQQVIKLPDTHFVRANNIDIEKLLDLNIILAIPIARVRLGNIQGVYGESMLHGQAPNKTIYLLVDPNEDITQRIRDILYIDYLNRFPLIGLVLYGMDVKNVQNALIKYFQDNSHLLPALEELDDDDMYDTIDDLVVDVIVEVWDAIATRQGLEKGIDQNRMLVYNTLLESIGIDKFKKYWLEQIVKPFIDKETDGELLLGLIQGLYELMPQVNMDYILEIPQITEEEYVNNLNRSTRVYTSSLRDLSSPIDDDAFIKFSLDRANYLNYLSNNVNVPVSFEPRNPTRRDLEELKDRLSELEESLISIQDQLEKPPRTNDLVNEFINTDKEYIEMYKKLQIMSKLIQNRDIDELVSTELDSEQPQSASRRLQF